MAGDADEGDADLDVGGDRGRTLGLGDRAAGGGDELDRQAGGLQCLGLGAGVVLLAGDRVAIPRAAWRFSDTPRSRMNAYIATAALKWRLRARTLEGEMWELLSSALAGTEMLIRRGCRKTRLHYAAWDC